MIESLLALLTSPSIGGGILGSIAGIWQGIQNYKIHKLDIEATFNLKKLELEQADKQNAHELQCLQLNNSQQLAIGDQKLTEDSLKASIDAYTASMQNDKATYSVGSNSKFLQAVDGIRGLMRPLITATALGAQYIVAAILLYKIGDSLQTVLLPLAGDMLKDLVADIRFLAVTCTLWWFGGRIGNQVSKGK